MSNIATYQMWLTQQGKLQAWNSKPIVEVKIDALGGHKDLTIKNLGGINIEDIRLFVTVYELATRPIDGGSHVTWDGIASSSKVGPIRAFPEIRAADSFKSINLLTDFQQFAPMYKGQSGRKAGLIYTYYAEDAAMALYDAFPPSTDLQFSLFYRRRGKIRSTLEEYERELDPVDGS